ncbi:hypothetical protein [Pseudomonas sichuanensis]|uniref:Lipoprotein n=1 Tax=Pseudomonas sichuanensis TaxID=2213015 RepID=A0ABV0DD02_9PSED
MKPCLPFLLSITASLISGCASPPLTTPDVIEDFKVSGQGRSKESALDKLDGQCWLDETEGQGLNGSIESARRKLLIRSCNYAYYHDSVKAFKARSDQATLGFASIAAIGAATNSHSDFVKSMVGLMGLSGAARVYVNPNVQMSVYIKSAIAAQCMAEALGDLNAVIDNSNISQTRSEIYGAIDDVAAGLNMIRYHPEIYSYLFNVDSGFGIQLVGLTANPDQDAANKKAAVRFLFDVERVTNQNLRVIHGYIEATLNAQAFNVENAVKVIPATPVPKPNTGGSAKNVSLLALAKVDEAYEEVDKANLGRIANILQGMSGYMSKDAEIPYADVIRINNDFSKCMVSITNTSE